MYQPLIRFTNYTELATVFCGILVQYKWMLLGVLLCLVTTVMDCTDHSNINHGFTRNKTQNHS